MYYRSSKDLGFLIDVGFWYTENFHFHLTPYIFHVRFPFILRCKLFNYICFHVSRSTCSIHVQGTPTSTKLVLRKMTRQHNIIKDIAQVPVSQAGGHPYCLYAHAAAVFVIVRLRPLLFVSEHLGLSSRSGVVSWATRAARHHP